jgi:hypothetical protein
MGFLILAMPQILGISPRIIKEVSSEVNDTFMQIVYLMLALIVKE